MATEKDIFVEKSVKTKPDFDYFNATNFSKLQAKTETTEKELNRFKTDYDAKKLNRVYEKYHLFEQEEAPEEENDFFEEVEEENKLTIQKNADFQKIIREQNSYEELEDTLTYKKIERNPKVKLNLNQKTRLMVFTYTFVSVMLVFLLIYNVFSISNLNNSITSIQDEIVTVERAIKDIGNMTESYKDEGRILDVANDLSFSEVPVENVVTVNLYEKQNVIEYQGQTNWFDAICKFLNNLFGG
jgi:cell division protein FtsL